MEPEKGKPSLSSKLRARMEGDQSRSSRLEARSRPTPTSSETVSRVLRKRASVDRPATRSPNVKKTKPDDRSEAEQVSFPDLPGPDLDGEHLEQDSNEKDQNIPSEPLADNSTTASKYQTEKTAASTDRPTGTCSTDENKDCGDNPETRSSEQKDDSDRSPIVGSGDSDHQNDSDSESPTDGHAEPQKKNKENSRTNFTINLTQEAKDLIRDLAKAAEDGKPPTVSRVRWLTKESLEQIIKYNDRPIYQLGNHEQLAAVVADYIKNGVPPRCPKCQKGSLRFSNGRKKNGKRYYWCPGFSPNGYHFFGCNFKASREEITRLPFRYPE